jgi:hypothetical protein
MFIGTSVLGLIVVLPGTDAFMLLNDFNYVFWSGKTLPTCMIAVLFAILCLFFATSPSSFVDRTVTVSHLTTLSSTFLTLTGVVLIFGSMYLSYKDMMVSDSIKYTCEGSPMTRDLRRYYLNLLKVRQSSACSSKPSVSDCSGYQEAAPPAYTSYLQSLEETYQCSGFCYTSGHSNNSSLIELSQPHASMLSDARVGQEFLGRDDDAKWPSRKMPLSLIHRSAKLPPALFSTISYKTSCDGAAARNMGFLTTRISDFWWYLALVIILLAVLLASLEWLPESKTRLG